VSEYNLGTASGRIEVDGRGAAVGFRVAETAAGAFFDVIKMRSQEIQRLGRRMAGVGIAGTTAFGIAIKTAADFEKQMSGVRAVTGGTEEDFESLRQKALDLGKATVYSASEAASAIEELAKAGIPVADILNGAADAAVALAAAGGVSIPEAATIAANAMNQFNLKASEMTDVADVLAGVANTSASDVSGIGQSLSQAGAVANLAGLSFRDTAIAIGEMADAGINGSDAGTSIKTMLNNLIPVTDKQVAKFKELNLLTVDLTAANKTLAKQGLPAQKSFEGVRKTLGKYLEEMDKGKVGSVKNRKEQDKMLMSLGGLRNEFFNAQGDVKKLGGLQATLAKGLKGMTKQQKLATLEVLFGADAMRATAILSLEGKKGYEEFSDAVSKTKAADVAATRLDNLGGAVEALKGSLETVAIEVGSIFLPAITKIVSAITWLINKFIELPRPVKTAIAILAAIASAGLLVVGMILALLPLIISFIANMLLMGAVKAVVGGLRVLWTSLRAGQGVMVASQAAALRTGTAFQTLGKRSLMGAKLMLLAGKIMRLAMAAGAVLMSPWMLALIAIIALAVILYKKWKPFRDLVNNIASVIKSKLQQAWQDLQPVIATVVAALQKFGNFVKSTLLPVIISVGKMLLGKLLTGWAEIAGKIMGDLMPAIKELVSKFQNDVVPAANDLWDAVQPVVSAFLDFAVVVGGKLISILTKLGKIFITFILPVLIKIAGFLGGVLIGAVVELVKGLIQAVTGIVKIFSGLIDFFAGLFTGDWSRMWEGVKSIFTGLWDLIIGALRVYLSVGILKLVGLAFKGLLAIVRGGWNLILSLFKAAGRGIWAIVRGAFNLIMAIIRGYINIWRMIITNGWRLILRVVRGVLNGLKAVVRGVFNFIKSFITGNVNAAKGIAVGGFRGMVNGIKGAVNSIKGAVTKAFQNTLDFIKSIPGKILEALGNVGSLLLESGKKIIQGLIDGIKSKVGDLGGAMKSVVKDGISAFTPFSPVKEGPLKKFNRGGTGIKLMEMLQEGITSQRNSVARATASIATAMSDSFNNTLAFVDPSIAGGMVTADVGSVTVSPPKKVVARSSKKSELRFVKGTMRIDPSGRVWVEGVAQEVVNSDKQHDAETKRRKK
jgi:TP901 family phage tail tape measure protein